MRYDILELQSIPRERDKLKAIIGAARYERRKSRLMRLTAYAMIAAAVAILLFAGCAAPSSSASTIQPAAVYLPFLLR